MEDTHTPGLVTREPVLLLISCASSLDQVGLWSFRFPSGLPTPPSQASSSMAAELAPGFQDQVSALQGARRGEPAWEKCRTHGALTG